MIHKYIYNDCLLNSVENGTQLMIDYSIRSEWDSVALIVHLMHLVRGMGGRCVGHGGTCPPPRFSKIFNFDHWCPPRFIFLLLVCPPVIQSALPVFIVTFRLWFGAFVSGAFATVVARKPKFLVCNIEILLNMQTRILQTICNSVHYKYVLIVVYTLKTNF